MGVGGVWVFGGHCVFRQHNNIDLFRRDHVQERSPFSVVWSGTN